MIFTRILVASLVVGAFVAWYAVGVEQGIMLMLTAAVFQLAINEESARRAVHAAQMEAAMCKIILGTAHGIEIQGVPPKT